MSRIWEGRAIQHTRGMGAARIHNEESGVTCHKFDLDFGPGLDKAGQPMARPLRIAVRGGFYHVMARGIERRGRE